MSGNHLDVDLEALPGTGHLLVGLGAAGLLWLFGVGHAQLTRNPE